MPKAKNAKADEALKLYRHGLKLVEIAQRLDLPEGTVRRWKHSYKWDCERSENKANVRKRGGQPGNRNRAAPLGNNRAEKYGFLQKYLPEETREIFNAVEQADPIDLMWDQIQLQYAAIIRAQRIAYVKDREDKTIEKVHEGAGSTISETWTVQQAWDKHAAFLNAQSRAVAALANLIRHYEKLLQERGDRVTEEQKLRLEKLRAETDRLKRDADPDNDDGVEVINDAPPG